MDNPNPPHSPKKKDGFSRKEKAVFLKYCQVINSYGSIKPKLSVIYKEVADAFFYENWLTVQHIILNMLKSGHYTVDDAETVELLERIKDLENLDNVTRI